MNLFKFVFLLLILITFQAKINAVEIGINPAIVFETRYAHIFISAAYKPANSKQFNIETEAAKEDELYLLKAILLVIEKRHWLSNRLAGLKECLKIAKIQNKKEIYEMLYQHDLKTRYNCLIHKTKQIISKL